MVNWNPFQVEHISEAITTENREPNHNLLLTFEQNQLKEIDPESFKSWRDHRGEQNAIVSPPRTYGVYFGVRNRRVSDLPLPHPLALQLRRNDGDLGRKMIFPSFGWPNSEFKQLPANDLAKSYYDLLSYKWRQYTGYIAQSMCWSIFVSVDFLYPSIYTLVLLMLACWICFLICSVYLTTVSRSFHISFSVRSLTVKLSYLFS